MLIKKSEIFRLRIRFDNFQSDTTKKNKSEIVILFFKPEFIDEWMKKQNADHILLIFVNNK